MSDPAFNYITFNDYSRRAAATAVYPEADTGSALAVSYLALGLGEAGEVQGKVKKILRDNAGVVDVERATQILDECGDVLWYLDRLAHELGSSLTEVALANIGKLSDRKDRGALQGSGDTR